MDGTTGGVVTRSYVTNLRKGRIGSPGYEKMKAIARVMGFPPEAWFEDGGGGMPTGPGYEGQDLAGRVEHLFGVIKNPSTGEPLHERGGLPRDAGRSLRGGRRGH